ncbi:unnamed protein product [Bursaphelenchus xylophilus]|uniref:(pine wood nematode) hypothetical protein n=1 Tax=Bursaphelenchus xylophilus TaxID=6326 RepID=A0A1I7SU83_BURXY|nr:unnamed protein product [Bursaphelenchus xylophilus]CAG9107453.1 unnamed protein product [Bursaphelenchus xylophilus]
MLATQPLHQLVQDSKASRAFNGNLLPSNNNASVLDLENLRSITVVEDDSKQSVPVAVGIFHSYTPNQYYCSAVATSDKYNDVFVNLAPIKRKAGEIGVSEDVADNHYVYKVAEKKTELKDLSGFSPYYSVFGKPEATPLLQSVIDELIDNAGHKNFDMKKNITVDLYVGEKSNDESIDLWRDKSGFVVSDKYRFLEYEVERPKLLSLLESSAKPSEYKFESLSAKTAVLFLDYDSNITVIDRQEYLEFLFGLQGVRGTVAIDAENQPVGYVLTLGERVLQLYADTEEIAESILLHHLRSETVPILQFFVISNNELFKKISAIASNEKRVNRYHTRILPSNVKWGNVFFLNMGAHLY